MKGYRVGQRVRVISARKYPELKGCVGTVTSELHEYRGKLVHDLELDEQPPPTTGPWCSAPENLEPIDEEPGDDFRA